MKAPELSRPLDGGRLTLTVRTTPGFHVRLRIGVALVRLGVWVMGGSAVVKEVE